MRNIGRLLFGLALLWPMVAGAKDAAAPTGPTYMTPPAPIPAMLDAAPTPSISVSHDRKTMAIFGRENLPSVAALARPILRLGGYRIDPRTNGPAEIRMNWLTSLTFESVAGGTARPVVLPKDMRFTQPQWSPDNKRLAFVARAPNGLELWVAEAGGKARKLTGPVLNAAFGGSYEWLPDGSGLLIARKPVGRGAPPAEPQTPAGPTIQESAGKASAIRTYEDLLSDPHDEALFDYYFTAELDRVDLATGAERRIVAPGLYIQFHGSPDGKYVEVERLKRPFSYLVPADRFPAEIAVMTMDGKPVRKIADRPLTDSLPTPFDAVTPFPREVEWRADAPATLVWAIAQDGGDTDKKAPLHDRLVMLDAPFVGEPRVLVDLKDRYSRIIWGRNDAALVITRRVKTRRETRLLVDPSGKSAPRVIGERNYQDQYNDPGLPLLTYGAKGRAVMQFTKDGAVLMTGAGAARDGEHPFLSAFDLATGQSKVIWQAKDPYYETVSAVLDDDAAHVLTRRESRDEAPNYFVRTVATGEARALTHFTDPEPQFAKVQKQLVEYKRADGVGLSGTLYLPAGYDAKRDGPLPLLMWAYPTEFTDAAVAGQVVDRAKSRFTRPQGISHLFLLTQGYAVLDGPSFPIIGAGGAEPNDTYIEQLTADAQAAVDAVVALGVTDRDHIAVGGHSYGAFMTANLLAHTDLFRAGIARSGAYNRTLTPFGFQAEQRTYWQAPDTYNKMSPFAFAPKIKAPILLIHGMADDNQGTFPIQSERFYAALKGAGATVRYVQLPNEPHGYRGRESTFHVLWEMTNWLDRFVKHAPARAVAPPANTAPVVH